MKSLWIVGATSYVFTMSDGVYLPLRLIAGFGLLVSVLILGATLLGKGIK